MKILAIIPARGGSEGLPGKNIKPLLGKPLIVHAIDTIKSSKHEIDIIVSTDSDEIESIARKEGVRTIKRPKELSTDNALVKDAIIYTINILKGESLEYDLLLLIEATSPLRTASDIDICLDTFIKAKDADCLATFSKLDLPVTRIWNISENTAVPFIKDSNPFRPRQEQVYGYYINGLVYIFKIETLLKNNTDILFSGKQLSVITNKKVVDIDTQLDFDIAELILKKKYYEKTL